MKRTPASAFTNAQRLKMESDAHGFRQAATFAAEYIDKNRLQPMSTARNAMTTVLFTNLGFSLELKLKAIAVRVGTPVYHTHDLAFLFEKLPAETKRSLEDLYAEGEYKLTAFKFTLTPTPPNAPDSVGLDTLQDFLRYLDVIGLFGRRYSFETYAADEWWVEVEPNGMLAFIDRITRYSNGLG